jgi:hypothetical protein
MTDAAQVPDCPGLPAKTDCPEPANERRPSCSLSFGIALTSSPQRQSCLEPQSIHRRNRRPSKSIRTSGGSATQNCARASTSGRAPPIDRTEDSHWHVVIVCSLSHSLRYHTCRAEAATYFDSADPKAAPFSPEPGTLGVSACQLWSDVVALGPVPDPYRISTSPFPVQPGTPMARST